MARETFAHKVHVAVLTNGTYATPTPLKNCVRISTKNNTESKSYESDGKVEDSSIKFTDQDVELEMSSAMTNEELGLFTSYTYDEGELSFDPTKATPSVALIYEIATDKDGLYKRRVLYNCKLALDERANETSSEGEIYKFVGKNNSVDFGGGIIRTELNITSEDANKTGASALKTKFDAWFTKVQKPNGASNSQNLSEEKVDTSKVK